MSSKRPNPSALVFLINSITKVNLIRNLTLCQIYRIPGLQSLKLVCFMVENTESENVQMSDFIDKMEILT